MHEHLTVTLHWVLAVCPHNHSLKQGIQVYFGPDIAFFFHWFNAYSRLGFFWCHGFHLLVALRIESSSFNAVAVSYTVLIKFRGPNVKQARHCIIQIHWHERCLTEIILHFSPPVQCSCIICLVAYWSLPFKQCSFACWVTKALAVVPCSSLHTSWNWRAHVLKETAERESAEE